MRIKKVSRIYVPVSHDSERVNLHDEMSMGNKLRGRVKIHSKYKGETKKTLIHDDHNLIVFRGRNWLMQRAFNQNMGMNGWQGSGSGVGGAPTTLRAWKDWYISWFSIGTGASISGSPLDVQSPDLTNYQLAAQGKIGGTKGVIINAKDYMNFDDDFPRFLNDPDLDNDGIEETGDGEDDDLLYAALDPNAPIFHDPEKGDPGNFNADSFLIAKVQITLGVDEGNADESNPGADDAYQDINEAGLYVSPTHLIAQYPNPAPDPEIFARVTFSTIRKTNLRELIFSWYIYF